MQIRHHPLLSRSISSQRELRSYHFGHADSGMKTYIQASLHADEIPGMLVAHHLRAQFELLEREGKIRGEIVLLPIANPIGLDQFLQGQAFGRFDFSTGINFNRQFRNPVPYVLEHIADQLTPNAEHNCRLIRQHIFTCLQEWEVKNETEDLKKHLQLLSYDADIMLDLHCDQSGCHASLHRHCLG